MKYKQCLLRRKTGEMQTSWLPEPFCVKGRPIEVKGYFLTKIFSYLIQGLKEKRFEEGSGNERKNNEKISEILMRNE